MRGYEGANKEARSDNITDRTTKDSNSSNTIFKSEIRLLGSAVYFSFVFTSSIILIFE